MDNNNKVHLKHVILSQQFKSSKHTNSFNLLNSFQVLTESSNFKLDIHVSENQFNVVHGNNLYTWGFDEHKFQVKNDRNTIINVKQIGIDTYIHNSVKQVYRPTKGSEIYPNILKITKFQQHLFMLNNEKQLLDQNRNIIKQQIDDIISSDQFIALRQNQTISIIGNFDYQLSFDEKIIQFSCGLQHIMCLTKYNQLYGWGEGIKGQLGNGQLKNQFWPLLLSNDVQDVSCASNSTVILKQNKAYWTGTNEKLLKQSRFLQIQMDHIFVSVHSSWNNSIEIIYAQVLKINLNIIQMLEKTLEKYEEDDEELLIPDDSYYPIREFERELDAKHQFNSKESQKQMKVNKSRSKTPVKKLRFQ